MGSFLCILCCRHTIVSHEIACSIINKFNEFSRNIQSERIIIHGWHSKIYNFENSSKIYQLLHATIRKYMKKNKVPAFKIDTEYFIIQIAFHLYYHILVYYDYEKLKETNANIHEFNVYNVTDNGLQYKIENSDIEKLQDNMIFSFHENFLRLNNNTSISIDTTDRIEIQALDLKFEHIINTIIKDRINMNDMIVKIYNKSQQLKDDEEAAKNNMNIKINFD